MKSGSRQPPWKMSIQYSLIRCCRFDSGRNRTFWTSWIRTEKIVPDPAPDPRPDPVFLILFLQFFLANLYYKKAYFVVDNIHIGSETLKNAFKSPHSSIKLLKIGRLVKLGLVLG
jgi:hypothetical protein